MMKSLVDFRRNNKSVFLFQLGWLKAPSLFPASASSQVYLSNTSSLHPWDIPGTCRLCRPPKGLLRLYCLPGHIYSVPGPIVNAWKPAFKTKIKNQNTLGKRDLTCENGINVSESIRIIQAWFSPFPTLHAHELHTAGTLNTWNLLPVPIHLPTHSYMRDKMLLERWSKERGVHREIVWIVADLHGRSEIETKQRAGLKKQTDGLVIPCGLYSQFPSEAFHMNEVEGHPVKVGQGEVKSCNQL